MSRHGEGMSPRVHSTPLHQKADGPHLRAQWCWLDTTRRLLPPQCEVVNRRPRTQRDAAHELGDAPRTHSRKKQAYVSASLYSLQGRLIPAWSQETRHVLTYWWSCLLSRANRDWCLAKLKKKHSQPELVQKSLPSPQPLVQVMEIVAV